MNTTKVYKLNPENPILKRQNSSRVFYRAESQKDAYLYHIEHVNVDSYIIDPAGMTVEQLKSIVEHIQYLNAIITILIYKPALELPGNLLNEKYIRIIKTDDEISHHLKEISKVNRDSNRVQWPLMSNTGFPDNKKESLKTAKVLSLSSSGCFVGTDPLIPLNKGDFLAMIFSFNDFDFYSDANVVRVSREAEKTKGIAVEFQNVSKQTQKCIGEIIDEKILSQIMDAIK